MHLSPMSLSVINASGRSASRLGIGPATREYAGCRERVNRRAAATTLRAAWARLVRVQPTTQATPQATTQAKTRAAIACAPDHARRTNTAPGLADVIAGALLYGVLVLLVAALA